MSNERSPFFNDRYISWLRHLVGADDYVDLSMTLGCESFFSAIMMDRNRVVDGANLRRRFLTETGGRIDPDGTGSCSVLEFLVALAIRVNDACSMFRIDDIFAMFLRNMDIDRCTDDWYLDQRDPESYILDRCEIMMARRFDPDGSKGGLFIVHGDLDLTAMEWWWQMNRWLDEQYIPDM